MEREIDWDELNALLDDDEVVFAALEHLLNAAAAVIDDEFREYAPWHKISVDVDDWINLHDPSFKTHFRMSRHAFDRLQQAVELHLREKNRLHRKRTDFVLCLMMALWILMNMDTFKNTALLFNTSPGVVLFHYIYIIEALREMAPKYIQWPSAEERQEIKNNFFLVGGYPDIVGVIDGMHSYVTAPLLDHIAYINRHHSHSILTQAVVDDRMLVRDLYTGEPGSLHDSRMFRRIPLSTNLLENPAFLSPGEHIIGDGGYILTDKCLIPYDDNGAMNEAKRHHNKKLSQVRSIVERGFGLTKGKFPRLKYFRSLRIEYAVDHIVSCFVLHNFIILEGEEAPEFDPHPAVRGQGAPRDAADAARVEVPPHIGDVDRGHGDFANVAVEPDHPLMAHARVMGEEKREAIAARLWVRRHEDED